MQVTVAFGTSRGGGSSCLELAIEPYVAAFNAYPPSLTSRDYGVSPPTAIPGLMPVFTAVNWPSTLSIPLRERREYRLSQGSYGLELADQLRAWAEGQLWSEVQSSESFEDAIIAFLWQLRDTSISDGRATIMVPTNLVRKVCDMVSWIRIWQASVIQVHGVDLGFGFQASQPLPESVTWELKSQAVTAINLSEREALSELDKLPPKNNKEWKSSAGIWACLWQMILIYRRLITIYVKMHDSVCSPGQAHLATTVRTVEQIHRLLLIKHATYFGSSSIIYHEPGQKSTSELHAGDVPLQRAWENIMHRRPGFCKSTIFSLPDS